METERPRAATLIPGDGIGPEVTDAAVRVIAAAGGRVAWEIEVAGRGAFERSGTPIPESLLASIRRTRLALKGPLETQVGRSGYRSVNVALRQTFDLFANVRPIRSLPGVRTAFSGVDLIVVRENTEDLYAGIEHQIAPGVVESVKVITARASRRIARFAFELARRENRRKVVAIHKANIMKLSDGLFLACARQVAERYAGIEYGELIVDNACLQLVRRPQEFDVLLLENLYGDIVSDLCAGLVGGLGVVPGANLGARHAIFEAVHGTAPDIAGKNLANPLAAILSGAMLLRHVGQAAPAARIQRAVERLLREGRTRTRDLGGAATTTGVTERLVALLDGDRARRPPPARRPPDRSTVAARVRSKRAQATPRKGR
jgi:isocitrate dehydrogenase (NAD+)